jgi:hypothetical protein
MALRVPKAPGFASMMKEGAKYTHGKQLTDYSFVLIIKLKFSIIFIYQVLKNLSIVILVLAKNYVKQQQQVLVQMV